MALAQISSSLSLSVRDVYAFSSPKTSSATPRLPLSKLSPCGSVFATGSPLLIRRTCYQKQPAGKAMSLSIRCEQGTQDNSLDVWLGRFAMIGFAVAITVEITTGKGLLEEMEVKVHQLLVSWSGMEMELCLWAMEQKGIPISLKSSCRGDLSILRREIVPTCHL
ncbi:stress enhanced protein 1, chloroplastic-like isoform X2 [Quercus robur]|uniref:stress enhanced protein 1, chloroplastic-like isoform X2 n=1 Tax=Quercus robur TaxID=38942 RepID=UPI002163F81A|nr:stress enhanced protein 1, chloroplastic-like isoform X2 [Quercus robur]